MKHSRYVLITIVSSNVMARLPDAITVSCLTGSFETAVSPGATISVTEKTALKSGSSQHGNALRASVACNWVVAMVCTSPASSVYVDA